MKFINRIFAAILAVSMFFITSCSGEITETKKLAPKFFLEKQTVVTDNLPKDLRIFNGVSARGDGFFTVLAGISEKDNISVYAIKIYDDNTTEPFANAPEIANKQYIRLFITETGFTAVSRNFENAQYSLVFDSYDFDFNLTKSASSDVVFNTIQDIIYDGTDYYISIYDERNDLVIMRFGSDFSFKDEPYINTGNAEESRLRGVVIGNDGKAYVAYDTFGEYFVTRIVPYSPVKIDTSLTEITDMKRCGSYFTGAGDYIFFGTDNMYLYGYKTDGDYDMIMPVSDLDLPYDSLVSYAEIYGENRAAFYSDNDTGEIIRYDFSLKIPEKDERTVLTISVNNADSVLADAVSAFNRISTKYKAEIDELGDGSNPLMIGFDKAMLNGTLGDILIPPQFSNVNYTEKGIYCDLYEFMDKDENFNRELFLPHILDALETDGKLLRLWSSFGIETYFAPDNALPPTYENIFKLMNEYPEKIILPTPQNNAEAVLYELLHKNAGYFTDTEKLGGEEMRTLLEICKKSGENPVSEEEFYTRFANGRGYYKSERIYTVSSIIIAREIEPTGEKYSIPVGNPVPSGEPLVYLYGTDIAINNASENKEAAWEFVKFYVSYRADYSDSFSVLSKEFEILADETAAETAKLKAQNGENYTNHGYSTGYISVDVRLPVREDFDAVLSLIKGAVVPKNADEELISIIADEAEHYFNGEKSIEETLDVIKNRAEIYISERG
jgi:ABC-type glycerol-3-phosphate transport system substrate-binding protein